MSPSRACAHAVDFRFRWGSFHSPQPTGCNGTGYRGRFAIHEVLAPDELLRHLIATGATLLDLSKAAKQHGLIPLAQDARDKVHAGLTTAEEVLRVLGPQGG